MRIRGISSVRQDALINGKFFALARASVKEKPSIKTHNMRQI
jgi:hypothetical protein